MTDLNKKNDRLKICGNSNAYDVGLQSFGICLPLRPISDKKSSHRSPTEDVKDLSTYNTKDPPPSDSGTTQGPKYFFPEFDSELAFHVKPRESDYPRQRIEYNTGPVQPQPPKQPEENRDIATHPRTNDVLFSPTYILIPDTFGAGPPLAALDQPDDTPDPNSVVGEAPSRIDNSSGASTALPLNRFPGSRTDPSTVKLVCDSLIPADKITNPAALREHARLLRTSDGITLGVAVVEPNNGFLEGPNNCLFLSLINVLAPGPRRLREMLVECLFDMGTPEATLHMGYGILAHEPTEWLHSLPPDELLSHCTDYILNDGDMFAPLLVALLESAARSNRLHELMPEPSDIVFFQESADNTSACLALSFRFPTQRANRTAMVMCNKHLTHFERLLPVRELSAVLTVADTSIRPALNAARRTRRPARFLPTLEEIPESKKEVAPPNCVASSQEPKWRSPFETKNPFAVLASRSPDVTAQSREHTAAHSSPSDFPSSRTSHPSRVPRQKSFLPLKRCFIPSGPRHIRVPLRSSNSGDTNPATPGQIKHRPSTRTLDDFVPKKWATGAPRTASTPHASGPSPIRTLDPSEWPPLSRAAHLAQSPLRTPPVPLPAGGLRREEAAADSSLAPPDDRISSVPPRRAERRSCLPSNSRRVVLLTSKPSYLPDLSSGSQTPAPLLTPSLDNSLKTRMVILEGGLPGRVSDRLPTRQPVPHPLSLHPSSRPGLPADDPALGETPSVFILPVKWHGRLHSVHLPLIRHLDFGALREVILERLCPRRYDSVLSREPLVLFYGCKLDGLPGSQVIRRLEYHDVPSSWDDLARLKHLGGYVEVQLPCRGGAVSGQPQPDSYQPPAFDDTLNWNAIDNALRDLAGGSPVTAQTYSQPVTELAQYLHQHISVGHIAAWDSWSSDNASLTPARLTALYDLAVRSLVSHPGLPDWYDPACWVDVRINSLSLEALGLSTNLLGQNPNSEFLRSSIVRFLLEKVPALRALRSDDQHTDSWDTFRANLVIRCNPSQSRYLSVVMLLPPEPVSSPWRSNLVRGTTRLSEQSYLTYNPNSTIVEVELELVDSVQLIRVATTLRLNDAVFMAILGDAFRIAFQVDFAQCRYSCEARSHHGNQRFALLDPRSQDCQIILGVSLASLLAVRRSKKIVRLPLGIPAQHPVSLPVEVPPPPKTALWALLHAAQPALRLISLEGTDDPSLTQPFLIIGPFPKSWLAKQTRSPDRITHLEHLKKVQATLSINGTQAYLISRQEEAAPFAVFLACPCVASASAAFASLRRDQQTGTILERMFGKLAPVVFESRVPPECVALMGEKGLRDLMRPPDPGGPPGHARV